MSGIYVMILLQVVILAKVLTLRLACLAGAKKFPSSSPQEAFLSDLS
ncbi:hypothetical protein HET73_02355 [Wolbachia endosymbiont of Atemnus politus]|nr:hypothetical protein [Wolbachia endosymbiont of Atemnus politus]